MALFRIEQEGQGLVPFAQYAAGDGLYEREVEDLLWDNLEEVLGRTLFRVARQAHLPHGGIPDILALDETGRIVVIEVKRDVDRQLLSQSLEYAGWARESNLQGETLTWSTGRHTIQVPPARSLTLSREDPHGCHDDQPPRFVSGQGSVRDPPVPAPVRLE